jgi:hypothetical protein
MGIFAAVLAFAVGQAVAKVLSSSGAGQETADGNGLFVGIMVGGAYFLLHSRLVKISLLLEERRTKSDPEQK